jgi:DNA-directed RNA polymerase subunit RPC12/RpoP
MARVNHVEKARKDQGECGRCGAKILAGMAYNWLQSFRGARKTRCVECAFRRSEMTESKLSAAYSAGESIIDTVRAWATFDYEDVRDEMGSAVEDIRGVASDYEDSANSIRDTFPDSPLADECEEKATALTEWADELDTILTGVDPCEELGKDDDGNAVVKDAVKAAQWKAQAIDSIEDAVEGLSL